MRVHLLAATIAAALPLHGVVVTGKSLGGLRLGDSRQRVLHTWGTGFGVCRGCARPTWYYNYVKLRPQGAGVEFRGAQVVALFTLWSPTGWHTPEGVRIGDPVARVFRIYGLTTRRECGSYSALLLPRRRVVTEFYVVDEKVWGFGLSRRSVPVCR